MKKFMNDPRQFETDMLEGLIAAHPDTLRSVRPDHRALVRADSPVSGKVALATGGGSGHLPLFLGYVGRGLVDGCAVGDIFASPSAQVMLDVTRAIHGGRGVLYLYGNYGGDVLNFDLAAEMATDDGIRVETVVGTDDVASAPQGEEDRRRGVAGLYYLYKAAGACADDGGSLEEVKLAAERAKANTRSMGVALGPTHFPATGTATFEIGPDEMELGMGIHGEPGMHRGHMETADRIVAEILTQITADLSLPPASEVAVMVNSLGATPLEELYIIYRDVARWLEAHQIRPIRPLIGRFATSMDMAGMSITLCRLDSDLKRWLAAPCDTPFWRQV